MENDEFLLKNIVAMRWTHLIALCHQPYHGGFTAKITGSPNMGTVNHATENLQWRLLILQIWARLTMLRKITDPPNMGTVNHVMEDLQWRLLILQIWARTSMPRRVYSIEYYTSPNIAQLVIQWLPGVRGKGIEREERGTEEQRLARLARWREHDWRRYTAVIMTIKHCQRKHCQERCTAICENTLSALSVFDN